MSKELYVECINDNKEDQHLHIDATRPFDYVWGPLDTLQGIS